MGVTAEEVFDSDDPPQDPEDELIDYNEYNDEAAEATSYNEVGVDSLETEDTDMQGSNPLHISVLGGGTPSETTLLTETVASGEGTMGASPNVATALPAADALVETDPQGGSSSSDAQATNEIATPFSSLVEQIAISKQVGVEISDIEKQLSQASVSNLPTRAADGTLASSLRISYENLGLTDAVPAAELAEYIGKFAEACGLDPNNLNEPGEGSRSWEQLLQEVATIKESNRELEKIQPFFHLQGLGDCVMVPIDNLKKLSRQANLFQAVDCFSKELEKKASSFLSHGDPVAKTLLFPFEACSINDSPQESEERLKRGQIYDHACLSRAMELLAMAGVNPNQEVSRGLISAYKNIQHQYHDRASLHAIYQTQIVKVQDMRSHKTELSETFLSRIDEMVKEKSLAKRKKIRGEIVSTFSVQIEAIDTALQETLGLPVLAAQLGGMAFDKANDVRVLRAKLSACADHETRATMRMAEECSAAAMLAEEVVIQKDVMAKQTAYQSEEAARQSERNRIVKLFWDFASDDVDMDEFPYSITDMLPPNSETGIFNVSGGFGTAIAKMFPDFLANSTNRHNFTLSGTGTNDRLTRIDSELSRPNAAPESANIAILQALRKEQLVKQHEFLNGFDKLVPNRIPKKAFIEQNRPSTFGLTAVGPLTDQDPNLASIVDPNNERGYPSDIDQNLKVLIIKHTEYLELRPSISSEGQQQYAISCLSQVDPNGPSEQAWSIANRTSLRKGTHLLSQAATENVDQKLETLMALAKFAISDENSVAEHFRRRLTAHTKKLRSTARTDPNVAVVVFDPKSDKYKDELSSAPVPDPNPTGSKRSRGTTDDDPIEIDMSNEGGTHPIDEELNLDKPVKPVVDKPVVPPWEIIKAPSLRPSHRLIVVFQDEEPQWNTVPLYSLKPFRCTSAKELPRFSDEMILSHRGKPITQYPKVLLEHWGHRQFMSSEAQDESAFLATTIEEGILMLQQIRFECHTWQTMSDARKLLKIENDEEWFKHDEKHPPKNKSKRDKAKRQQILKPEVFKSRHAVRQQWNMNSECWTWADMEHGGALDHQYQNILHEYANTEEYRSLKTVQLAAVSDTGIMMNSFGYQRLVRWHVKQIVKTHRWLPSTGVFFANLNIATIDKMVKNVDQGPMSVINQKILLPLPTKRFLKIKSEEKLFLKTGVKSRMLIEDEERAALRYNVLTREFEFFPGSYLTYRPAYPKSSLLGMKNSILRYAGLKIQRANKKEVSRVYKSLDFVALDADIQRAGYVEPTFVDPKRIRLNLPTKVAEARACLIAHFAFQYLPISQKPFAAICEQTAPDRNNGVEEYHDYLAKVVSSLQTLDTLIRDAPTHGQSEVYLIQRKLSEMIVPDETLQVIYGLPDYKSDITGGSKPYRSMEDITGGRVPFQNTHKPAEASSDNSAPTTAARTADASNQDDQDMATDDASDVGAQGTK